MYKNWFWFIKIFCYLILLILLNRIAEHYDFLVYVFLFFMMSINFKNSVMFVISFGFACLCAISFSLDVSIVFIKCIACICLIIFFLLSIFPDDKRRLLELMFYKNGRNSKLIKKIYYKKIHMYNRKLIADTKNSKQELRKKTNATIKDIFIKSKLRYYGFYKKRTNYIKRIFYKEDYLMIFLVFLVAILLII